jgi:hypothetical protein
MCRVAFSGDGGEGLRMKEACEASHLEVEAEIITVIILTDSVAFTNGDGLRRLLEVGAIQPRRAATAKIGRKPHSELEAHFLSKLSRVGDLENYRKIVGDPQGHILYYFMRGTVLTMERGCDPRNSELPFYSVLDTAIGGTAAFLAKLAQARRINVTSMS